MVSASRRGARTGAWLWRFIAGFRLRPLVCPVGNRIDRAPERAPFPGQRVFDPNRHVGDDRALDDPFLLEFLETIAQHAVGDVGDGVAQRREAALRLEQAEDDGAGPAAADELAGAMEARAQFRGRSSRGHGDRSSVTAGSAAPQAAYLPAVAMLL